MAGDRTGTSDRVLYGLIALAVVLSLGHHIDHVIRGNNVGWPVDPEVNAFTYSLAIYPLIVIGLILHRAGKVGPGFWAFLSGGGALFLAVIHFAPDSIEPPSEIVDPYDVAAFGWLALAWLVVFVGALVFTFAYELRLRRQARAQDRSSRRTQPGGAPR
jgi:hypothetical protein